MSHIKKKPAENRSGTHGIAAARIGFQHSENFGFCISGVSKNPNSIGMRSEAHNVVVWNSEGCVVAAEVNVLRGQ